MTTRIPVLTLTLAVAIGLSLLSESRAQAPTPPTGEIAIRDLLVLRSVGRGGRTAVRTDPVEARIVAGTWEPPKAGDTVSRPNGTPQTWEKIAAKADGGFEHPALAGGYAYATVAADAPRVMVLEASGHGMVYVNGVPRTGDPYGYGYVRLPVALRAGRNDLLFQAGRGRLRAMLTPPKAAALLNVADATLPDRLTGEREPVWAAVVVLNATEARRDDLALRVTPPGGKAVVTPVPPLLPLTTRKVGFRIEGRAPDAPGEQAVKVEVVERKKGGGGWLTLDTASVTVRVRRPTETYKRTFISETDGSVQYYAVTPAVLVPPPGAPRPALFLSLHGASVEALGQAAAYGPKTWGHLVAPTNRRPYGFDWEDWGRLDALEVLGHAQKRLGTDPNRTYLTGHSMGGHGTWQLGVTYPDLWAAIGPSAGWISFRTYGGGRRGSGGQESSQAVQDLLDRAAAPSETLEMIDNLADLGVYILHGDADDNVPVTEARTMRHNLGRFHADLRYHEQPNAGHWWDASPEPGADCVDWWPLFDFFSRRTRPAPETARQVHFTTANPGVSARFRWATIEALTAAGRTGTVRLRLDPAGRRFAGATENVARLALDLTALAPGQPVHVEIDGQVLENLPYPAGGKPRLWLSRSGGNRWAAVPEPSPALKGPHRYGPFKDAFRHRMVFVYGTKGTAEENAWALAKARYDAEQFWYRGNGSVDIVPDTGFDAAKDRDRGVILYGSADTNAAWDPLLSGSPVQVRRGSIRVGSSGRTLTGDDLACLFLRPRPGSDTACVGVVSGSGPAGMRLTDRMAYFVSGAGFPDCLVVHPDMLRRGAEGIRAAGFFGLDWGVETGEWVLPPPTMTAAASDR